MVCMRDERLARCSCRHPVIINLNLLSLFSWHHRFSSICHHDVTLYQFLKVLKTLFVLLSMSNCNRLQAIQPFIREPVQKFQAEKKVHKNQNLFFNIQRVPSNTFLQQVAFKSRPLVYLSYPSIFLALQPEVFRGHPTTGQHQAICQNYIFLELPSSSSRASIKLFAKGIFKQTIFNNYLWNVFTKKKLQNYFLFPAKTIQPVKILYH